MVWKAPSFWNKHGWQAQLLRPLSCLYEKLHSLSYHRGTPYHSSLPVICVGNIVAGGGGKSPAVQALLSLIDTPVPAVLLRGYGGSEKGPLIVEGHNYHQVGDEALLHAAKATTIVSANRAEGAKLAEKIPAGLILMDDGFQNNQLAKTISFLVVDERQGLGNGLCLPAGPLREPLAQALSRTDAILLVGEAMPFDTDKPVFRAHIEALIEPKTKEKYLGFCGIGVPDKFKRTLIGHGFSLADFIPYADHYPYTDDDITSLKQKAADHNAVLITTEKDFIRIPEHLRSDIQTLPIRMIFEKPKELAHFIRERL